MSLFLNKEASCQKNIELLNILDEVINCKKKYILRGGLAIALYFKKIYRCHQDIDFYFDENDFDFWVNFFSKKYRFNRCQLPKKYKKSMFSFLKDRDHYGHLIFVKDIDNKESVINKIYDQEEYKDELIINKYSKFIPITKEDKKKAIQNAENPVDNIEIDNRQINILNVKYLKEQKIFGLIYNKKNEDNDLKFYFNCDLE